MKAQTLNEVDVTENELINLPAKLFELSRTRPNDVAMRHKSLAFGENLRGKNISTKCALFL